MKVQTIIANLQSLRGIYGQFKSSIPYNNENKFRIDGIHLKDCRVSENLYPKFRIKKITNEVNLFQEWNRIRT